MNDFLVREYSESDYEQVAKLMEDFQVYLSDLDSMKLLMVDDGFGKKYLDGTLDQMANSNAKMLLACLSDEAKTVVGLVAGMVSSREKSFFEKLGHRPKKEGFVSELFVSEQFRGKGIARKLLAEMEKFFLLNNCTHIRLSVMADNQDAHKAYLKMGYQDRTIEMLKKLS